MNIENYRKLRCHLCKKLFLENELLGHVSSCIRKLKSKPGDNINKKTKPPKGRKAKNKKRHEWREERRMLTQARDKANEQREKIYLCSKTNISGQRMGFDAGAKVPSSNLRKVDK